MARFLKRRSPRLYVVLGIGLVLCFMLYGFFIAAPIDFPKKRIIVVERGTSLGDIAERLYITDVIRSPLFFRTLVRLRGGESLLRAGAYHFDTRTSVFGVAGSLVNGENEVLPIRVTLPEGATVRDMALILAKEIPDFDEKTFIELAMPKEGFLFPDTYLIAPGASAEEVLAILEENFTNRIETLAPDLSRSKRSLRDVVIMASLLEKEARSSDVRRTIAGILWKRLDLGMPLQVDAVFGYIRGTKTYNPTFADLGIHSPYNTYLNKGLPPGAIGNPGLEAIRAALVPIQTAYLFYLMDREGRVHYSSNFDGHLRNRALYLDS